MKRLKNLLFFVIGLCLLPAACKSNHVDETDNRTQLPAPTVRLIERTGAEALLEWNSIKNAASYVYYLTDEAGETVIPETGISAEQVRLTDLAHDKIYRFHVKAVAGEGWLDSEFAECAVEALRLTVTSISAERVVFDIVPTSPTDIYCYAMLPSTELEGVDDEGVVARLQQRYGVELNDLWNTGRKKVVQTGLTPATAYELVLFMWSPTAEKATSGIIRRRVKTTDRLIRFTRAVETYLGQSVVTGYDVYRLTFFNDGIEEIDGSVTGGTGLAISLDLVAPPQLSTLIPTHLYSVAGQGYAEWSITGGSAQNPRGTSHIYISDGDGMTLLTAVTSGSVHLERNDRMYTVSGDLTDTEEGTFSFTFRGRMEQVYDPDGVGDGMNGGPLVGIRFLVEHGQNYGMPTDAMLQFFFYPNQHVDRYKYMLLNDAAEFDTQSPEQWRQELLNGNESGGYYTGDSSNRAYYVNDLEKETVLMAIGISTDGTPGALTFVRPNGIPGHAGNAGVFEDGYGPWVEFYDARYENKLGTRQLSLKFRPSIRALHTFACILEGNPLGEGTYPESDVIQLLTTGSTANGVIPNVTEVSFPAEPGEVVTFAVLGTNLDRVPGQLNWIALKAPAEVGQQCTYVGRTTNTGEENTPIGTAALNVTYSVVDAGTLPGYEQYPTFPAVTYKFEPNIYCTDFRCQGGFQPGKFETYRDMLVEYFGSVRNNWLYLQGGWYGRADTTNDELVLVYNPVVAGHDMDFYFIGYNRLGEPGEPDFIHIDIPAELPRASAARPPLRPVKASFSPFTGTLRQAVQH